jgi:hypothetical protein
MHGLQWLAQTRKLLVYVHKLVAVQTLHDDFRHAQNRTRQKLVCGDIYRTKNSINANMNSS